MNLRALRILLACLVLSLIPAQLDAQPVTASITMRADRTEVEPGGQFELTVTSRVIGSGQSYMELPDLSAFTMLSRAMPRPMPMIALGGSRQVDTTSSQTLRLTARQPGTYRIAPATLTVNGQRIESNEVVIQVGGGSTTDPPPPGEGNTPANFVDAFELNPNGFIRTVAHTSSPFVRQQVTVTIYLYVPGRLSGTPTPTQEPTTEGFWVQDLLPSQRTLRPEQEYFEGNYWNVYVMRRFAAFPMEAGELTIGGTEITLRAGGGIFAVFGAQEPEPEVFRGPALTLHVRELPAAGRPAGDIHVGDLSIAADLDRAQIPTGDAVTLTLTAVGRGVMAQLPAPRPAGDHLRVLDPDIRDIGPFPFPNDVVAGTRMLRFLIIPEREGEYPIGPFEIPYFDPHREVYGVARTTALSLTAAGNPVEPTEDPSDEETENESAGPSFGPIHTDSALSRSAPSGARADLWLYGFLLWPLLFAAAIGVRTWQRRSERDDPASASRRSKKQAQLCLKAARGHVSGDQPREFYAAVAQAIKEALEGQLGHAVGSLTHRELGRTLRERGMTNDLVTTVVEELEGCDFARFSAVGVGREEMQSCLSRAESLMDAISRFQPAEEAT